MFYADAHYFSHCYDSAAVSLFLRTLRCSSLSLSYLILYLTFYQQRGETGQVSNKGKDLPMQINLPIEEKTCNAFERTFIR